MNSTYDYDPASRDDELVEIVANVLRIVVPVFRADIAVILSAVPWCESILFIVSCFIMKYTRVSSALPPILVPWYVIQEGNGRCTRAFETVPRSAIWLRSPKSSQ